MSDATADLLLEVGTEEIPTGELQAALAALPELVRTQLGEARLASAELRVWGTPRRLAVRVADVARRQADLAAELTGPPEKVAFGEDGQPTQAAVKFAEKIGLSVEKLTVQETPRGRYLIGTRVVPGRPARDVLPELLRGILAGLGFRRSMRWGPGEDRFVRPVRWLVALFGDEVLPLTFAGVTASNETRGHRFLAPEPVVVSAAADYEQVLAGRHVLADPAGRRQAIEAQIQGLEQETGLRVVPDEELLAEVTHLVEEPTCVCGRFDEAFLAVPREVIVSAMRRHQRYFAMERPDGTLASRFVTVLGTDVRDRAVAVRGNERVLAARLADARFFWDEDRRIPLAEHAAGLRSVVFQARLGTVHEKVERVSALARLLAPRFGADAETTGRAAGLCKADLTTHMVGEFPDLQGVMGRHYALAEGLPRRVADAILEHYLPRGAGDALPGSAEGAALSAADRLDTLAGCIGAGLKPGGGGDPFGLRRAALGLLRLLLDRGIGGSLAALVGEAAALQTSVSPDAAEVTTFVLERLRGLLAEQAPGEIVQAVLSAGGDDPLDLAARVAAVRDYSRTPEYEALATTFRRMNILKQADLDYGEVDPGRFVEPAEEALYEALRAAQAQVQEHLAARDHDRALAVMAGLRPPVDRLFDEVKVMTEDPALRANRLALLSAVDRLFRRVADFKRIAT